MKRNAAFVLAVLAFLLAGAIGSNGHAREYGIESLDLLRLLAHKPWLAVQNRWDRVPRIEEEIEDTALGADEEMNDVAEEPRRYVEDELRFGSEKRSAVATALNSGRRRRQPAPALGVLNDVGSFFDSLRDNLETLASLSPDQRSTLFQEPPTVVQAPASGGGGGGHWRPNTLRPLRPTAARSYDRRSTMETGYQYRGANHHDPGLLWTGLGR